MTDESSGSGGSGSSRRGSGRKIQPIRFGSVHVYANEIPGSVRFGSFVFIILSGSVRGIL